VIIYVLPFGLIAIYNPGLEQVDELRAKLVAEHSELRCKSSLAPRLSRCPNYWKLCDMGQRPLTHIKHHY
jgi:hypothetical protein